jgi:chorismate synthase
VKGRHDACIVPKAVPVIESSVALILVDQLICAGLIPKVLGVEGVGEYSDIAEEN